MLISAQDYLASAPAAFTQTFTLDPVVVVSLVIGSALLAMLTAALVSWRAVRVRPLEVLRYE